MSLSPTPSSPPSAVVQTPRLSKSPITYTSSRSGRQTKKPVAYGSVVNSDNIEDYLDDDEKEKIENEVEEDEESDDYEKGGEAEEDDGDEGDDVVEDEEASEEEEPKKAKKGGKKASKATSRPDNVDKAKKVKETIKVKDKQTTIAAQIVKSASTKPSKALTKPSVPHPKSKPVAVKPKATATKVAKSKKFVDSDDEDEEESKEEDDEEKDENEYEEKEGADDNEGSPGVDAEEPKEEPSPQRPFSYNGKPSKAEISTPIKPQSSINLSSPPTAPKKPLGVGAETGGLGVKPKITTYGSTKAKAGVSSKTPGGFKSPLLAKAGGKVELKKMDVKKVDKGETKTKVTKKVEAKKAPVKMAKVPEEEEEHAAEEGAEGSEANPKGSDDMEEEDASPVKPKEVPAHKDASKAKGTVKEMPTQPKTSTKTKIAKEPSTSSIASDKTRSSSSSKRRLEPEVVIPTRKRSLTGGSDDFASGTSSAAEKKTTKAASKPKTKKSKASEGNVSDGPGSHEEEAPTTKSKSKKTSKIGSESQPGSQPSDFGSAWEMDLDEELHESQMPMVPKSKKVKDETSDKDPSVNDSQGSQDSKKSTPSKKRKSPEDSSQSTQGSSKKKPAPPEKITSEQRALIMAALTDTKFLNHVKFDSVGTPGTKYGRHWREVLSKDLTKQFAGQGVKGGAGKAAITPEQRLGIWKVICDSLDKADWAKVADETGMAVGKLKRHFRETMKKEGEKFIGNWEGWSTSFDEPTRWTTEHVI